MVVEKCLQNKMLRLADEIGQEAVRQYRKKLIKELRLYADGEFFAGQNELGNGVLKAVNYIENHWEN